MRLFDLESRWNILALMNYDLLLKVDVTLL